MLTGMELLIALLAVVVGATIMGTVSFGMGLVVAPVLLLFLEPKAAIVTVNAIIPILLSFVLLTTWRHLKFNRLKGMAIGGILAVPLGVLVLDSANPTALRLIIGAAILCLGVLNLLNIQLPMAERRGSGLLVGFLTSLLDHYPQHWGSSGCRIHNCPALGKGADAGCPGLLLPLLPISWRLPFMQP